MTGEARQDYDTLRDLIIGGGYMLYKPLSQTKGRRQQRRGH
jgi:hypothetical protein